MCFLITKKEASLGRVVLTMVKFLYSNFVCILALFGIAHYSLPLPYSHSLCLSDRTYVFLSCHAVTSKVLFAAILPSQSSADDLLMAKLITVTGLSIWL